MRSLNTKALVLGVAAIAAAGASTSAGCSATKPTEIVPGALTQVQVPKDLAGIQVEVEADGKRAFCVGYQVAAGLVELPSTLGVIQGAPGTTLRIVIRGYDTPTSNDLFGCYDLQVDQADAGDQGAPPRVLRQAVLTYVDQHTLFLPMPLSYSCYDMDCSGQGSDMTCVAGSCNSGEINPATLPDFTASMVDGTQQCFSPSTCFTGAQPATVVDASTCTFSVPPQLAGVGSGLNVRIAYTDDTWATDPGTGIVTPVPGVPVEEEILNQDPNEGFVIIPDTSTPTQFSLAPGLCGLYQNFIAPTANNKPPPAGPATFHTISDIEVATNCPAKLPLLPFCAGEQHGNVSTANVPPPGLCGVPIPLVPTPSAVYLVMDNSGSMGNTSTGDKSGAFGPDSYTYAMNLSFALPIFQNTYVAFKFLDHQALECNATGATQYLNPTIPFGLSGTVQPQVAAQLENPPVVMTGGGVESPTNPSGLYLEAALGGQAVYQHISDEAKKFAGDASASGGLNIAAAMVFVNRTPAPPAGDGGTSDAGTPAGDYPTTALDCNGNGVSGGATPAACNGDVNCLGLAAEIQGAYQKGITTYIVVLNDQQDAGADVLTYYQTVASAAGPGAQVIDATSASPAKVLASFEQNVAGVGTCLYDLPAGVTDTSSATMTITIPPMTGVNTTPYAATEQISASTTPCNAATAATANGWGIDNGRIRVCGGACTFIQGTLGAVALGSLTGGLGDGGTDGSTPSIPDGGILTSADGGVPAVPAVPIDITVNCGDAGGGF